MYLSDISRCSICGVSFVDGDEMVQMIAEKIYSSLESIYSGTVAFRAHADCTKKAMVH